MSYAKMYVDQLIDRQAQSAPIVPAVPKKYHLPGLRTFVDIERQRKNVMKKELELAKTSLVDVNRKIRSKKYAGVKEDLKVRKAHLKKWIVELQFRIGREKGGNDAE